MTAGNGTYTDVVGAAARLRLSYPQTLRLILRGDLEAVRINGRWHVHRESLERLAAQRSPRGGDAA
ncbi:MAG TPA: helix-turn-helix domain-containing protein [Gemmatimonadales bacterium]